MVTITIKNGGELQRKTEKRGTIHNVFILDRSGSMALSGSTVRGGVSRYNAAITGINSELTVLRASEYDNKVSLFEFDSVKDGEERIVEHYFATDASKTTEFTGAGPSGNTPLYQTIDYVINLMLRKVSNDDTVLMSIYTDGQHNGHWGKHANGDACKALIADMEKNRNFVFTFVGTERDTALAIRDLGISRGNTIAYNGTSEGFSKGIMQLQSAKEKYRGSYFAGEQVDNFNLVSNSSTNEVTALNRPSLTDVQKKANEIIEQSKTKGLSK